MKYRAGLKFFNIAASPHLTFVQGVHDAAAK